MQAANHHLLHRHQYDLDRLKLMARIMVKVRESPSEIFKQNSTVLCLKNHHPQTTVTDRQSYKNVEPSSNLNNSVQSLSQL